MKREIAGTTALAWIFAACPRSRTGGLGPRGEQHPEGRAATRARFRTGDRRIVLHEIPDKARDSKRLYDSVPGHIIFLFDIRQYREQNAGG